MSSPQSPADFLSAVREKSQQLEEEMTNHREVPAGGSAKHHHQVGPKQGMHDTKIHDANPNQNPSSTPSRLIFPAKEKGRKRKEQLIWSMSSFPFLFPVIPQIQHCFILLDLVLISVLLLPLQRMAAPTEKPITWEKVQVPMETTRHCGPDPPTAHRTQQTCSGQGCEPVTCALQQPMGELC